MQAIERQIQVSFRHQVHFTHRVFDPANRLLRDDYRPPFVVPESPTWRLP